MKKSARSFLDIYPTATGFNIAILFFRVAISIEIIVVHGLKKIGIGTSIAEQIPNPLYLPESLNAGFAIAANLFFPVLVIFGLLTRLAILPVLAVTLTGYFILHLNDPGLVKDTPFMYSVAYITLLILGPGKYSIDHLITKKPA